ncbi:hypothetical protein PRIPAC_96138 [Pristionchus pacificus]|uniref:Uncharacterized protein n=1 Tax=Pristionchus pacificus TaxID=54126 RepID=A0A2A6BCZ7_PRIPA|nr:hypothetical protein PRIPAC_96138 [Pristionchus pacificus]|eukprot:PDM63755.1 hypothetical protein PRIPAC_49728 [Pristionchus pacificus]
MILIRSTPSMYSHSVLCSLVECSYQFMFPFYAALDLMCNYSHLFTSIQFQLNVIKHKRDNVQKSHPHYVNIHFPFYIYSWSRIRINRQKYSQGRSRRFFDLRLYQNLHCGVPVAMGRIKLLTELSFCFGIFTTDKWIRFNLVTFGSCKVHCGEAAMNLEQFFLISNTDSAHGEGQVLEFTD